MMLTRRNQDLMPSLIDEMMNWTSPLLSEERFATPKMNVTESQQDFEVKLCVPGLKKEDLSISLEGDSLLVQMQKTTENKEQDNSRRYLRREFGTLQFKQTLLLPDNVNREQISAKVEDGVLTILLPKFTEEEKKGQTKLIEIC